MDVQTAIRRRHSTRRFAKRPAAERTLDRLMDHAAAATHIRHPGARVTLVNGRDRVADILPRYVGIYGLVEGAPHMLIGLLPEETDAARLDLGYFLEQVVLEATRLGLATCWITGSYDPDEAARIVRMEPGESVVAAVAMGYPREDRMARLHDRAVRRLTGGHRRKPLQEIVFDGRWGQAWSPEGEDPDLVEALTCAQLAPSAVNRQPWRFIVGAGEIALALVRPAPIDGGITMSHIALAAQTLGRPGHWSVRLGDPELARELDLPSSGVPVGVWQFESPSEA
jgi:nitroreductase